MRFALALLLVASCGTDVDLGGGSFTDAGGTDATQCGSLVSPSTSADCRACSKDASDCQPNGCYGGYWCNVDASDCRQLPTTCP